MPCGSSEEAAWHSSREASALENMLCGLATRVEEAKLTKLIMSDPTLAVWWEEHKKSDSLRKAREAADKERTRISLQAKKKLSKEEIEALGLR